MTVSISDERRHNLLDKVRNFARSGKCWTLKDLQSIAGHINWSLVVFPLLKPTLSAVYSKIANKSQLMASVCINNAVQEELLWFTKHAHNSNGISSYGVWPGIPPQKLTGQPSASQMHALMVWLTGSLSSR